MKRIFSQKQDSRQTKKYRSQIKPQEVALILFLAHEGVTQPDLWLEWKKQHDAGQTKQNIIYKTHCPLTVKYGASFCKEHRLGMRFLKTSWCSPSLVYEYLRCLRYIYENVTEFREASEASVFLVSGYDIPIAPPSRLFANHRLSRNALCMNPTNATNVQWVSMTKKTVLDFITFFTDMQFRAFMLHVILYQGGGGCPDERVMDFFLSESPKPEITKQQMTDCIERDFRSKKYEPSPITWYNTTDVCSVNLNASVNLKLNLMNTIYLARCIYYGDTVLFFRKVSASCHLEKNKFTNLLWKPEFTKEFFCKEIPFVPYPVLFAQQNQKSVQVTNRKQQLKKNISVLRSLPLSSLVQHNFDFIQIMNHIRKMSDMVVHK